MPTTVTIGTQPTRIVSEPPNPQKHAGGSFAAGPGSVVELHNSGTVPVYLGGKNVTTSSPIVVPAQGHAVVPLAPNASLYGVAAEPAIVAVIG